MRTLIFAAALALLLLLLQNLAAAAGGQMLEDIRFRTAAPGEEQVVFRLDSPVVPESFAMKSGNPRLVFDFPDTSVARRIRSATDTGGKLIVRVRVGIHDNKTRAVLDLLPYKKVKISQEFDKKACMLTVTVRDAGSRPAKAAAAVQPAEEKHPAETKPARKTEPTAQPAAAAQPHKTQTAAPKQPLPQQPAPKEKKLPPEEDEQTGPAVDTMLSAIVFERSNRGEMVRFKLNRFHPPAVYGLEDKKNAVICEFQDTVAASRLPESIRAAGKLVRGIRIEKNRAAAKVKVLLDLTPNRSYDLQQVFFKNDNVFVLIVNTLAGSGEKVLRD